MGVSRLIVGISAVLSQVAAGPIVSQNGKKIAHSALEASEFSDILRGDQECLLDAH